MKKYIVKNCPACYNYEGKYGCEDNHDKEGRDTYCECITNCVIKQIVEKCMEDWKDMMTSSFQRGVLDLLDICEVE